MTTEELDGLGLTHEELSTLVSEFHTLLTQDRISFTSDVMTPQRKAGFLAIRQRASDGQVDLSSIDLDTALLIKTMHKFSGLMGGGERNI
jgi:hypothetical protein